MSVTDLTLARLNRELLNIRVHLGEIRAILRTCSIGVGLPAVQERELLQMTSQLHPKLNALAPRLREIAAQLPQLSAQTHRSGSTSTHGHLGNLRGTLPLVERELTDLQVELKTVHGKVQGVMNDPRRTSTIPSGGLQEAIELGIELITMVLERVKRPRK